VPAPGQRLMPAASGFTELVHSSPLRARDKRRRRPRGEKGPTAAAVAPPPSRREASQNRSPSRGQSLAPQIVTAPPEEASGGPQESRAVRRSVSGGRRSAHFARRHRRSRRLRWMRGESAGGRENRSAGAEALGLPPVLRRLSALRRVGGARIVVVERPPHRDEVRQMADPGWRHDERARNG
jgi:hypothetical protein